MGVKKQERNVNLGRWSLLDLESVGFARQSANIAERRRHNEGRKQSRGKSSLGDSGLT